MGQRRKSRELALQALFYIDMVKGEKSELNTFFDLFCDNFDVKNQPFLYKLVQGVVDSKLEIDNLIEKNAKNWKLSRISCIDKNIIRVAVYELLYCKEIPAKVSINEAIEISKKFSTPESGSFINGILDSIYLSDLQKKF